MGIRFPLKSVGNFTAANELGAGSVAGGLAYQVTIPQDSDNVVLKFTASVVGAVSAVFQTTDDGGSTWYDVARTSVVSNANNTTAEWLSIPTAAVGVTASRPITGSVMGTTGSAAASTLAASQFSGLPLLSTKARVFVRITGNVTSAASNTYTAKVVANSESSTA